VDRVFADKARFYTMHLAPPLFGGWDLMREWGHIGSPRQCSAWLLDLTNQVDLRKTTRGPKKPPTPRTQYKGQPHVSTAKLLAESKPSAG